MSQRWSELSPRTRRAIMVLGSFDAALKAAALVDLRGRSNAEINGSKKAWGVALALVNSAGVLPIVYFLRGRRRPR